MGARIFPPRLSRAEIRDLGKVATELMSVHESLQRTNWAGAQTSATIVGRAIELIARVYVRARPSLPEVQAELLAAEQAGQEQEGGAANGQEIVPPNPGILGEE